MGGEGQSGIKTFHLTGRKTHENHFPKEIDGKGQGPMKDPEEQWLDYSISFTAEYTYTHALFKGRAFLSLLKLDAGNLCSQIANHLLDFQKVSKTNRFV